MSDQADDRGRYRCAVVVFVDARGVDYQDAASGAEMNVRHALAGAGRCGRLPVTLASPLAGQERFAGRDMTARVVGVMDLGTAAGNGYLWTEPTSLAWRDRGHDLSGQMRRDWSAPEATSEEVPSD